MATINKEVEIQASPDKVWDALRDVGALHSRLAAGFVVDTKMEGNARVVTFANGMVVREDIVAVDDAARRVAWAIIGQQFHHYNGAAQVFDHADGTRFVWTTDLLPDLERSQNPQLHRLKGTHVDIVRKTNQHTVKTG